MRYNYKKVNNPLQAVFNDLKLFEQNNFCYDYLKQTFSDKTEEELNQHSDVAAACFRQANEYYKVAINSDISTSPLVYSYALNNLLKGVCYLKSFDDELLKGFKSHGFSVNGDKLSKVDALSSRIILNKKGAVISLLKLYNNHLNPQEIKLYKIIRHIPNIDNFYFNSSKSITLIAKNIKDGKNNYIIFGNSLDEETGEIFQEFSLMGNILSNDNFIMCCPTMLNKQYFEDGLFDRNNVFYKDYMNIPEKYEEGLKDINISFYCYLLIMSYGMMVRYNANIWEKYIDKKRSPYSTLIELSIPNAVINFYYQMHYLLFGFYYENDAYTEIDIKKMIDESTPDIMNNITRKLKSRGIQYGKDVILPWEEKVR